MGLAVETPTQPDLTNRPSRGDVEEESAADSTEDLRRAELEEALADGAWNEAFQEWAEYTDLTESEYRRLRDAGGFEGLDFYWDPEERTVQFAVVSLPESVADQEAFAEPASVALSDLGETVVKVLEDGYLDWDAAEAAEKDWSEAVREDEPSIDE